MRQLCLMVMLLTTSALTAAEVLSPYKLAHQARFELLATADLGEIGAVTVADGDARIEPTTWASPEGQGKGYVIHYPINQFSWTECVITFTAANKGALFLKLTGPLEPGSNGVPYHAEVLWDEISASGMTISNGGFEECIGNAPVFWEGGGVANAGPMPPLKDRNYGRSWFVRPLLQKVIVEAGKKVEIHLFARSFPPFGSREMRRVLNRDSLAHQMARHYRRGVNLGNYLEVPPSQKWGVEHGIDDFNAMRAEGFDHVRIPIGWHHYTGPGPEFKIAPDFFAKVDGVITNVLKTGMFALINLHHFDELTSNPLSQSNKFLAIWSQVADRYAGKYPQLSFELLNEPKDAATTEVMNGLYTEALKQLREKDIMRTVFVGPGKWNSVDELSRLWLPPEEENVIVTLHNYEPFFFTHQGASWGGKDTALLKNIVYPGPPGSPVALENPNLASDGLKHWMESYNTLAAERNPVSSRVIRKKLELAGQWSRYYGRPVHLGEYGCYTTADSESRARYYSSVRRIAEEFGLGWAIWDWKAGFKYWDSKNKQPLPGMREALFGEHK